MKRTEVNAGCFSHALSICCCSAFNPKPHRISSLVECGNIHVYSRIIFSPQLFLNMHRTVDAAVSLMIASAIHLPSQLTTHLPVLLSYTLYTHFIMYSSYCPNSWTSVGVTDKDQAIYHSKQLGGKHTITGQSK